MSAPNVSYLELLRRQPTFRRIWLGDVVSLGGDWFTTISLFAMMLELTGKGEAVGFVLMARFLPALFFGPLAGVLADRLDRKAIMVAANLLRALVVLGFLLVRTKSDVPLAYLLSFVQLSLAAMFDPAEQAAVGSVVAREEIVTANALQGATWSAVLAVGALLGGVFAQWAGRDAAFALNSATYLVSALLVLGARIPKQQQAPPSPSWRAALGLDDLAEGARFVTREPGVRRVICAKAGWGIAGGGAIMLYSVFGERIFPVGRSAATGIGILYAARGVGALLGPTLSRQLTGDDELKLDRFIGFGFVVLAFAYALFGAAPWLWLGALALVIAHLGASTLWSFSTSLLNLRVPDRLRGRAFAADIALQTVTMSLSTFATGYGLDHLGLAPRVLMGILAAAMLVPALGWQLMPRGLPTPTPSEPQVAPKKAIAEPG